MCVQDGRQWVNPPPIDLSQHRGTTKAIAAQNECKLKKPRPICAERSHASRRKREEKHSGEVKGKKVGKKVAITECRKEAFTLRFGIGECCERERSRCFTYALSG